MSRTTATSRPLRLIFRTCTASQPTRARPRPRSLAALGPPRPSHNPPRTQTRTFTTTSTTHAPPPSSPPSSPPQAPPTPTPTSTPPTQPTPLSPTLYAHLADTYLDRLLLALEELADNSTTSRYEVEYSAGVLSIETPQGIWIINKQPPNRQIWVSSPVSGPKRFDYVEGEDGEGGADYRKGGRWVYLRDGTGLSALLRGEVGVVVPAEEEEED